MQKRLQLFSPPIQIRVLKCIWELFCCSNVEENKLFVFRWDLNSQWKVAFQMQAFVLSWMQIDTLLIRGALIKLIFLLESYCLKACFVMFSYLKEPKMLAPG